jgi:hypothetical protein
MRSCTTPPEPTAAAPALPAAGVDVAPGNPAASREAAGAAKAHALESQARTFRNKNPLPTGHTRDVEVRGGYADCCDEHERIVARRECALCESAYCADCSDRWHAPEHVCIACWIAATRPSFGGDVTDWWVDSIAVICFDSGFSLELAPEGPFLCTDSSRTAGTQRETLKARVRRIHRERRLDMLERMRERRAPIPTQPLAKTWCECGCGRAPGPFLRGEECLDCEQIVREIPAPSDADAIRDAMEGRR